ncbi:MAG: peptidase domain-containing ABC transporter [Burkholderiales bacterium]|nr:peptidase domain-containing ABC transporter [Burkholderiales bacterium]
MLARSLSQEDFVWLAGSLAQLYRVPFDPALLVARHPPPHTVRHLIEALGALGFKSGAHAPGTRGIGRVRFPCIAFQKGEAQRPALLLRADGERLLYFEAGEQQPRIVPLAAAPERFEPELLLVGRAPAGDSPEAASVEPQPGFGLRWFAAELLRHRRIWRDVLAASLVLQLVGLATPLGFQVVIDKVVVHQTLGTLAVVAAALALALLFNAAMSWLRQYLVLHTGNRVDAVLGSRVFRHLVHLPQPYFERRPTGTLVARVHAVETIREFLAGAAVMLLLDLPFLFVFVAVMFAYSGQLTLIALAALSLVAAISFAVAPLLRARINRQFLLGARNQAFLTEHVSGIETVKALQMEPRLSERYDALLADYLSAGFATRQLANSYGVVAHALEQAMTVAILCAGALLVMRNEGFTIGMLVAFQMFAARLSQPVVRLAGLWQEFQQAAVAVRRLADIMDAAPEPQSLVPARAAAAGPAAVQVQGLSFRYSPAHPWVFRNFSAALKPGALTVLTGPSGSGKSTLAKLLLGFYFPEEGRILLDGRDLRHLAANELRAAFGVVPQETRLFSGTIYDNLVAGNPSAGLDDVVRAAQFAEIHEAIERLPQGYRTEIGEHGVGLSGGQKQRIAIARALLRRPRILVFDEATSGLDAETAEKFAQTVNRLKGAATILFIAHQVPRGLEADERVVLAPEQALAARSAG